MDSLDAAAARQLCRPNSGGRRRPGHWPTRCARSMRSFSWWRDRAEQVDSAELDLGDHMAVAGRAVSIGEARGISHDGADYAWSGIFVATFRDGLFDSVYGFEPEDEEVAFEYAESQAEQRRSRLAVANASSRALRGICCVAGRQSQRRRQSIFSRGRFTRQASTRRCAGNGRRLLNEVVPALLSQYDNFETHILAVRGDRLCLAWSRWSDESGNEATNLHLTELGEDGLITRPDVLRGDDFWSAYRELERRYYAGEGAPYAAVDGRPPTG